MNVKDKKILIDFGSTYTKVVLVDLDRSEIISKATHPSTVDTDITIGLRSCLERISEDSGERNLTTFETLACSSAAGGLRIVCVGFVPDYSSEAANLAALGAGAKIVGCFSYELTEREIIVIEELTPDIILLTGGTDGGDKRVILHNAKMLTGKRFKNANIIVAGNKTASDEIESIFGEYDQDVIFSDNVMPEIGKLDIEECNKRIRDIYLNNIIDAKGIGKAKTLISNILMPTPSAVLNAAKLLAEGYDPVEGLGELLIIDVGGATTDVHSIARSRMVPGAVYAKGLPEPYVKRTVEGDLGLSHNLDRLRDIARERSSLHDYNGEEQEEQFLTYIAVDVATERHVGRIESKYGPTGEMLIQYGKDLNEVKNVIGTGGPIVHSENPPEVLKAATFKESRPDILKPKIPNLFLDTEYILFAGGLIGQYEPEKALKFMLKYLKTCN